MRHCLSITLMLFAVLAAAATFAQQPAQPGQPKVHTIKQFRLPDMDETGRVRGEIFGDSARVPEEGLIDIANMRLLIYGANGSVELRVTSPHCAYNRERSIAGSKSSVLIENKDFILSGEGYLCHLRRQRLEIANQARLVLRSMHDATDKPGDRHK